MKRFIYSLSFVALLSTFASAQEALLSVRNTGNVPVVLNWINFQGQEQTYQTIAPEQHVFQPTYLGHQWRVRVAGTNEILSNVTMTSYMQGVGVAKYVSSTPRYNWCGTMRTPRPYGGFGDIKPDQPTPPQPGQPNGLQQGQPVGTQPGQPIGPQTGQPTGTQPVQPNVPQPGQPAGTQPGQSNGPQPGQPTGQVGGFGGLS